ncbi:inositol 1,4,5-trisphosphate receptor-interacting protein-like 1 [Passer domesticus]|uniref:inositol 1,4,5-trisphosphate receptor-interacting protein-like 1 n=1 Tax=Passer domesticus TaxID=48849 RepID=UPI0030FED0BB
MDAITFFFMLLESLIQYLQPVGDVLDEEKHLRMELRAKRLERKRIRLEREVEQLTLKQSGGVWGEVLWFALKPWQVWAVAGLLALVLGLYFFWRKRSDEADNSSEEDEDHVSDNDLRWLLDERIQWPVQDLQRGCEWTLDLMDNYTIYFGHVLSNSFYPVLQRAIGVGSAFEGWSPREQDVVYSVFIPMTPPRGHSFHLELDSAGQGHVRNFRVRVQLECTCSREQQAEDMLCFLHHPEEELRSNQDPSLLDTLCTGSYLDVQKTALWFHQLVRAIWPALPQSHNWHLTLLPSTRSCRLKVTYGTEIFQIEMLFGVRRGDSDIFVSSQPGYAGTPSTLWLETYDVAEIKFFQHIARQAPDDSLHLKCLQLFSYLQLGIGFSTYTMKTIVMHLLNTVPVSRWRRRYFLRRLGDISENLRCCLEEKCLNHFIIGNKRLPQEISLPLDIASSEPPNLFHHLASCPVAHSQAMNEYQDLQRRLASVLLHGH